MPTIAHNKTISRMLLAAMLAMSAALAHAQYLPMRVDSYAMPGDKVKKYSRLQSQEIFREMPPHGIRYTKAHPLIVALDWAFPPFSYINEDGTPDGMLVEVVREIFAHFRIAYELRMMSHAELHESLRDKRVGLAVDIDNIPAMDSVWCGHSVVADYNVAAIRLADTPMMRSIMLLKAGDTLMVNKDSYSMHYLLDYFKGTPQFTIRSVNYSTAIKAIIDGTAKYFIWDEMALRSLMRRYNLANEVKIESVDVPSGKLRFYSADTLLLHELDITLEHLQATNQYQPIYRKWLGEQSLESKSLSSQVMLFALLFIAFITLLVLVLRTTMPNRLKSEFRSISRFGIEIGHSQLVAMSVKKQWVYNVAGDLIPKKGMSLGDFITLVHPDDRHVVLDAKEKVDGGKHDMPVVYFRMRRHDDTSGEYRSMVVNAAVKTHNKRPTYVYLAMNDDTERQKEERSLNRTIKEYSSITDMSDVGRAYFDGKGSMRKCNDAFVAFFDRGGLGKATAFLQEKSLKELCVMLNGIILEEDMDIWFCTMVYIPELNLREAAEIRLRTVWDEGRNVGYIITLYAKGAAKGALEENKAADIDIGHLQAMLHRFHSEMKFIMRRNRMYTFQWEVGKDYLELSEGSPYGKKIKFQDYAERLQEEDRKKILAALWEPQKYITKPMHVVRQLRSGAWDDRDRWYDTFIMPDYGLNGEYKGVYGLRCEITEFMDTQNKLRQETEKALDSGRQKALFLQSMTHELRTPLNAINGFAEIMSFLTTNEEKKEYADIMAHNCTMLISLIDNILQISTIDTEGLRQRRRHVDFAKAFREGAESMRKYIANPDVSYRIDMPMQTLTLDIDAERVLQILDIFVNNSSKFTTKGFVHVGFRYGGDMLTVYCRDTGRGIPQDKQEKIFERFVKLDEFVQGAGLGLSLAKTIADLMGATIDIYSREGEGTVASVTFDMNPLFTPPRALGTELYGNMSLDGSPTTTMF